MQPSSHTVNHVTLNYIYDIECVPNFYIANSGVDNVNPVTTGTALHEVFDKLNEISESTIEAFIKFASYLSETNLTNTDKELLKRCVVVGGRQQGKSVMNLQGSRNIDMKQATQRLCDCLKCRMGKPNHCTTYSPKKRRGK